MTALIRRPIRVILVLSTLFLMAALSPAVTNAGTKASGECGYLVKWTLDDSGTLSITADESIGGVEWKIMKLF